jgi:chaperonin GroEL
MNKLILKFEDVKDEIKKAVSMIADPVIQTLGPMGGNVLYEDSNGDQFTSNDGVTIARHIIVDDPVSNAVIEIIKQPALQANNHVGDGTTTSILLSKVLINEGMKFLDEGMNRMVLKGHLELMGEKIKERLKEKVIKVEGEEDILRIAKISANNDDVIAKDVARVIEVVGEDGMVFIEPYYKAKTELIEDTGFNLNCPLMPELANGQSFSVVYEDIPTLVTDKRIYYKEEAETILKTALNAGWDKVCVVARDFIGLAPNYFVANHSKGVIKVLLVKDPNCTETNNSTMVDLASYLGTKVYSEKTGKLVDNLKPTDFVFAKKIVANQAKTILVTANPDNQDLKARIEVLREELEKDKDNKEFKHRLSTLTTGTVTIKVGGRTPIEVQERIFRYEDAVNACRAAIKDGYLVGGGLSLLSSFVPEDHSDTMRNTAKRLCQASVRQLATNCGKHEETILESLDISKGMGYNAKTDKIENLLEAGVIDPYRVTEIAVDNAVSITIHLLTSAYLIIHKLEKKDDK